MPVSALVVSLLWFAGCGESAAPPSPGTDGSPNPTRVEVKVAVPSDELDAVMTAIARDNAGEAPEATERAIWFFDTPKLDLARAGLFLRARKVHGAPDDSTVKVRPMRREQAGSEWLALDGFKCEVDGVGPVAQSSCSLTREQGTSEITHVVRGTRQAKKLFSSAQEALAVQHATFRWSDVRPLGPIASTIWKWQVAGLPEPVTVERWVIDGQPPLVEISTRAPSSDADVVLAALQAALSTRGVHTAPCRESKTEAALTLLSR